MSEILLAIAVAAGEIIISTLISDFQQKSTESRSAHATKIGSIYQAVIDKFGLSKNQLDQLLSKLDVRLSQLNETAQGSARLSRASQNLRDFVKRHPEYTQKINEAKNYIEKAANNLASKQSNATSRIESRSTVTSSDVLKDMAPEILGVNTTLTDINKTLNNSKDVKSNVPNQIDTSLVDKWHQEQEQKRLEREEQMQNAGSETQ